MAGPTPKCVLDRSRPCNSCVADNPAVCPYPYLLGETILDEQPQLAAPADPADPADPASIPAA